MTLNDLIKRLEEIRDEHGGELPVRLDVDGRGCEIYDLNRFATVPWCSDDTQKEVLIDVGY